MSAKKDALQKRPPRQEPTLLVGDLDMDIDSNLIDSLFLVTAEESFMIHMCLFQNITPFPIIMRKSATKNELKQNFFYQYNTFQDARRAWKLLNGTQVPGMDPDFRLDVTFTKQESEVCAFFSINDVHLNRLEIYTLMSRYWSVLGLCNYQFGQWHAGHTKTACFVRFSDPDDCMQAISELNGFPVEEGFVRMTPSARYIDQMTNHVMQREKPKLRAGLPIFHNFYEKRRVGREEFNLMTMTSSDFFDDLEASRWSSIAFQTNLYSGDLNRRITLDYFEHF